MKEKLSINQSDAREGTSHDRVEFPPSVMLYPVPAVMVSCAGTNPERDEERPNIITIAWAGTICSEPPMLSISVRKQRHSHKLISETGEFVVNLVDESLTRVCDYCGVRSGTEEDKFAAGNLTAIPAKGLRFAPAISQAPVYMSCNVRQKIDLGSHDMFIAEIMAISVKRELMNENGKICLDRAGLICYVHGDYYGIGKMLGFFGYSIASPEKKKSRMKKAENDRISDRTIPRGKRKISGPSKPGR
jgi:flavin reductase (DIM6/NTAB) family NADH-FMN oxidoreductase RutF